MDRQEYWRQRYTVVRPGWTPTTAISPLRDDRVRHDTRILDIGCGHADLLASSLARTERAVGVDADERALAANEVFQDRVAADAERLPFRPGSFDLVSMAWVLEHIAHPVPAFREIRRALGPGGRIVFVTPNAGDRNAWLIRMVPIAFHASFTSRLYGRPAEDTYPTRHRLSVYRTPRPSGA
jgi:SAM-dependent methyltransferase